MQSAQTLGSPKVARCAYVDVSVIICAMSIVSWIATTPGNDRVQQFFAPHSQVAPVAEPRNALIITANRRDELAAIATLTPRGFNPLFASNERETLAQIHANPRGLQLAVVDNAVPEYALIARALTGSIPNGRIIVLDKSHRSQDVGPMLLDRL